MTTLGTIVCLEMVWLCHEPHRLLQCANLRMHPTAYWVRKDRCKNARCRAFARGFARIGCGHVTVAYPLPRYNVPLF
jgi:hypothetical protein